MIRLIERTTPELADRFRVEIEPSLDGSEQYEIFREGNLLVLRGTSRSAAAAAYYRVLSDCFGMDLSGCGNDRVYAGGKEALPDKPIRQTLPTIRWGMTYECYLHGAMMWDFARWERELDRIALLGVNCMYMPIGQEAVLYYAALDLGVRREDAMAFLSGFAYFPYQLMGQLDSFLALTDTNYLKARRTLAQQILARMKELGIAAALPGFNGHVSKALKGYFKHSNLFFLTNFAEFPFTYRVAPRDPLFRSMADAIYRRQNEFYGTANYYVADPFYGVVPRMRENGLTESCGKAIFDALRANVPDAVWVSHICSYTSELVYDLPKDGVLILDDQRQCTGTGLPYVDCLRLNKGGHTVLAGDVRAICQRDVPQDAAGVGLFDEYSDANPLLTACAGRCITRQTDDPDKLFVDAALRRWGSDEACLREAAQILLKTCYNADSPAVPSGSIPACRPSTELTHTAPGDTLALHYDNRDLCCALELMLASEGDYTEGYAFDVCDVTRQMLSNYARRLYVGVIEGFVKRDGRLFETATNAFLRLLDDLDRLLRTRDEFCLRTLMDAVAAQTQTQTDKQNFEVCLLSALTMFGPYREPNHYDLLWKEWSALTGDYYAQRWHAFFEMLADNFRKRGTVSTVCRNQVEERNPATGNAFYKKLDRIERKWITGCNPAPRSDEDTLSVASELLEKYAPMIRREAIQ